jgi:tRNA(fMet)-specific endonuclease VapC
MGLPDYPAKLRTTCEVSSAANREELVECLGSAVVDTLPITEDVVGLDADIVHDLRQAGTPVPANDIWIAAVAARHGAPVVRYDQHFRAIARVGTTILIV